MTNSAVRTLSETQARRLLALPAELDVTLPGPRLLGQVVMLVARAVEAKAALLARRNHAWAVLAESSTAPVLPAAGTPDWSRLIAAAEAVGHRVEVWEGTTTWTLVGLRNRANGGAVMLLEGDWRGSATTLAQLSQHLLADRAVRPQAVKARVAVASHRLARALSRVSGERDVCQVVLAHVTRALPARIGAIAIPDDDGHLRVQATHGYPLTLVEHLRIPPGTGVFGAVFERRAPMRVQDVTTHPAIGHRRSRYRTDSFVAVPLVAGAHVLAVLALTDKTDGQPFTRDDLSALRALVAPAALALARERERRQAERFALSAAIDPVSGLYNRRYFESRLDEELSRSRRTRAPVALLMVDVDDFKGVNDRYGHQAGDTVIRDVADILRRSVRGFDVCSRWGGEEFAILMPGNGLESAATTAERIRQRIEAYRWPEPSLAPLRVTASLGVAASEGGESRALVEQADKAMYAAKRAGKNRVCIAPEGNAAGH